MMSKNTLGMSKPEPTLTLHALACELWHLLAQLADRS
jgi:hypothetical protein